MYYPKKPFMATTQNAAILARELGRAMMEMRNYLRREIFKWLKENNIDISFELLEVLVVLYRKDGINQQEIADEIIKDKSSMTYLIDNLVRKNIVIRKEAGHDRRHKLIYLTKEGKALQRRLNPRIIKIYGHAAAGIEISELEKALEVVQHLNSNLK